MNKDIVARYNIPAPSCVIFDWNGTLHDGSNLILGANLVIELLSKRKIPMCILSNDSQLSLEKKIHNAKMKDKFFAVRGVCEDNLYKKPDPRAVSELVAQYKEKKIEINKNVWFVGDQLSDMQCASNVTGFWIDGPKQYDKIEKYITIQSLQELIKIIELF